MRKALKEFGRDDILIVVGGVIPPQDYEELKDGAAAIFGPGTVITKAALRVLDLLDRKLAGADVLAS